MAKQNNELKRTKQQNYILDLEKNYMEIIKNIVTSNRFLSDLKHIEDQTREYYNVLQEIWGRKNKIKEASERLLRHHMYTSFDNVQNFYPSPISCDIALELKDVILHIDVKTIDKIGNSGELTSTQIEHNQTSFVNKSVNGIGNFPGFKVKANLNPIDTTTTKPVVTYLVKIGYSDDGKGIFNLINETRLPSIVVTCLPNGTLSELFEYNLFSNFKDYEYFTSKKEYYYTPKKIVPTESFSKQSAESKFRIIEREVDIPKTWEKIEGKTRVGYYDNERNQLWYTVPRKKNNHSVIYLEAVKDGKTTRFNDTWLKERYDSNNQPWDGIEYFYQIYDNLKEEN